MHQGVKFIWSFVGLVVILAVALTVLYFAMPAPSVPATVVGDPALPSVTIDGVRLHAEARGRAGDPVVVVLHGGPGGDYRSLLGLTALSDAFRLVFYDQRGAGLSERVSGERLDLEGYLAELDLVIDAFSPDAPVHLVGHSWGAMLATAYLGMAPENVASAVLVEPGFFDADSSAAWRERASAYMSGPRAWWQTAVAVFEALHINGPDASAANDHLFGRMAQAFANHPDNPYHCPSEPYDAPHWRFGAMASQRASAMPAGEINRIAAGERTYPGPVLLLASACNSWIGPDLQAEHAAIFVDAALHVIPATGHEAVWDNPVASLSAIRAFLMRHRDRHDDR